jgi:hypothetical protein
MLVCVFSRTGCLHSIVFYGKFVMPSNVQTIPRESRLQYLPDIFGFLEDYNPLYML